MQYDYLNDPILGRIRAAIIDAVAPEKIILFGSRARGEASENSDYDIVVIADQVDNEREITRKINYRLLHEDVAQAVDVVVASPENWNRNLDTVGFVYKAINAEGILLYG